MYSIMEVYLNRIVFISFVFAVIYLTILKINSCTKKFYMIWKLLEHDTIIHFIKDDDYLAE